MRSAIKAESLVRRQGKVGALGRADSPLRQDAASLTDRDEMSRYSSESIAWAIHVLRDQAMPSEEIGSILGADDPELVRRYLELHRERLEERLADQRRTLARLERLLAAQWLGSAPRSEEKEVAGR